MKKPSRTQTPIPILEETRKDPDIRTPDQIIVILVFFATVFLCSFALTSLARSLLIHRYPAEPVPDTLRILIYTYTTVLSTAAGMAICRMMEGRSMRSMGITKKKLLPDYALGFLFGFILISAAFLLQGACGAIRKNSACTMPAPVMILLLIGWMLQGFNEEFFFRSWLTVSLGIRTTTRKAVIFSAIIFMSVHLTNRNISLTACLNLFLFGVITALLLLRTGRIWSAAALHTAWNWAQGNLYGFPVSGISSGASVFHFAHTDAPDLLTGGGFGPEGSILTTCILLPTIVLLLILPHKNRDISDKTES
ncbi:MAG TPA: hypothetical protein DCG49_02990 [Ruminococcus sp.]|nr:hypothetical protein [Ruminococcus sp.]